MKNYVEKTNQIGKSVERKIIINNNSQRKHWKFVGCILDGMVFGQGG